MRRSRLRAAFSCPQVPPAYGAPKRKRPRFRGRLLLPIEERSEALLVLHVDEATDVETTVVRVAGVRLVVVRRRVTLEDVVRAERDGGVPRGVPADLDVVEGGRTQLVHRNVGAQRIRRGVVRQAATIVEVAVLLDARVVAGRPGRTEVTL